MTTRGQPTAVASPSEPLDELQAARATSPGPLRETNGITSRLVLKYVEGAGGREALKEVLALTGLEDQEAALLDENHWFSYDDKIALFEAAAEVLDDPEVMIHVGQLALELNVGQGLKVALRALGSPRLVYQNIVRANAKFSGSHAMDLLELGHDHARIRYRDLTDQHRYHPLDCQYNRGLLVVVPALFGLPFAHITHPVCGCRGADSCVYELRWDSLGNHVRFALACGALGASAVVASAVLAPAAIPAAAAGAAAAAGVAAQRTARSRRARWRRMERELREQADVAQRLTGSLQDLVSELRLDEVLAKVTRNARSAVGGKEFALLVDEGGLRCQSSTGVPRAATAILERWAETEIEELWEPTTIDDVCTVDELAPLAIAREGTAFGSICAAPLVFRGQHLGVLVALATQAHTFLPSDLELIQSYASQAAIALANARLYEAQEEMARRDPLTGLLNHRVFHETVAAEIERCKRYASRFSVVVLDLDHFKQINDAQGHTRGDEVLRAVGETLALSCRASESAFRVGGDEFAFVLPASDRDGAVAFARRTHDALVGMPAELRASFGIAEWPGDATDKDDLLAFADARLYDAKHKRG